MSSVSANHKFVFLAGLHRSGTSLLFQCLREHPELSGFHDTGVPEDEGQHLQTVYAPASRYGGPGVFGFAPQTHLTEDSPLANDDSRRKLFEEWRPYWDLSKAGLLEKTPQNLLQTRFLQALFPNSYFLVVTRHPVAVAYATRKWSRTSLYSLIEHWLHCHERFDQDRPHLNRVRVIRYEDFVANPSDSLREIYAFLGFAHRPTTIRIRSDVNDKYLSQWRSDCRKLLASRYLRYLSARLGPRAHTFGYRLLEQEDQSRAEPTAAEPWFGWATAAAYRSTAAIIRVGARSFKRTRKHVRHSLRLARRRQSAVH